MSAPRLSDPSQTQPENLELLPGMAIVAVWMLLVCCIGLFGVIVKHFPGVVTIFCALLAAGAQGLIKRRRWGWAIARARAGLSGWDGVWGGLGVPQPPAKVGGMVNRVLFLYLVRPEVIERVR